MSAELVERLIRTREYHAMMYDQYEAVTEAADLIEAQAAEIERLRVTLDDVREYAKAMRNSNKLVGFYPADPAKNRIWSRARYHDGKHIMEMLKP